MNETIQKIDDYLVSHHIRLPPNITLALELSDSYADYYYADHDKQTVFFLDDLQAQSNFPVWHEVKGVTSLAHIRGSSITRIRT